MFFPSFLFVLKVLNVVIFNKVWGWVIFYCISKIYITLIPIIMFCFVYDMFFTVSVVFTAGRENWENRYPFAFVTEHIPHVSCCREDLTHISCIWSKVSNKSSSSYGGGLVHASRGAWGSPGAPSAPEQTAVDAFLDESYTRPDVGSTTKHLPDKKRVWRHIMATHWL